MNGRSVGKMREGRREKKGRDKDMGGGWRSVEKICVGK